MKKYFFTMCVVIFSSLFANITHAATAGSIIKGESYTSLYYLGSNGKRYVFPNDKTYFSWYSDFSNVTTISDSELASFALGGNVTYRPGKKLIKITTDPKTYAVDAAGTLRWITNEDVARLLYGIDWNKQVDDVPDEFFVNYKIGAPVTVATDFNPVTVLANASNVDNDKNIGNLTSTQQQAPTQVVSSPALPANTTENTSQEPAKDPIIQRPIINRFYATVTSDLSGDFRTYTEDTDGNSNIENHRIINGQPYITSASTVSVLLDVTNATKCIKTGSVLWTDVAWKTEGQIFSVAFQFTGTAKDKYNAEFNKDLDANIARSYMPVDFGVECSNGGGTASSVITFKAAGQTLESIFYQNRFSPLDKPYIAIANQEMPLNYAPQEMVFYNNSSVDELTITGLDLAIKPNNENLNGKRIIITERNNFDEKRTIYDGIIPDDFHLVIPTNILLGKYGLDINHSARMLSFRVPDLKLSDGSMNGAIVKLNSFSADKPFIVTQFSR